ncbi:MAG: hypothetical protein IJO32_03255 [Bacilli bacterium]|nr:hypothetical protein [Bacilli bacterium]
MEKSKLKINNKEYILPESVEYFFKEYLQEYYKKKKLNDLSKMHNKLLTEYKNLNIINFNRKRKLKIELYKINNEMMQIGIASNINVEIPNFETITDMDEKFHLMYKFNDLLCNTITILSGELSDSNYEKIYRYFIPIINRNIDISKKTYNDKKYEITFKNLYSSIEKCLILYEFILQLNKNEKIDINPYIPKK